MARVKPNSVLVRNNDTSAMARVLAGAAARPDAVVDHASTGAGEGGATALAVGVADAGTMRVGGVYEVPIHRVRENRWNARVFYRTADVDAMALSTDKNGQAVPARGYVDGSDIILVDGQKRLRGSRANGRGTLRIEICERPQNEKDAYLESRRINTERSEQTPLDDAVRFQQLLAEGVFANQSALATELGCSQGTVSRTVSLTTIPEPFMHRLKDTHLAGNLEALEQFVKIFRADVDEVGAIASDVLDIAVVGELSGRKLAAVVESKLDGPKRRARSEVRYAQAYGAKVVIKTNEEKGRIDFSVAGLTKEQIDSLRGEIEQVCARVKDGATSSA